MKQIRRILSVAAVLAVMQMIYLGAPGQASAVTCRTGYRYNTITRLCVSLTGGASYNPAGEDPGLSILDPGFLSILNGSSQTTLQQFLSQGETEGNINQLDLELTAADLAALGVTDLNAFAAALSSLPNFAGWSVSGSGGMTAYSLTIRLPDQPASVPEPSTILLLGAGLFGLAGVGIMRRKKTAAK